MSGGNKRLYILKKPASSYDLLLPLDIKGLKLVLVEGNND